MLKDEKKAHMVNQIIRMGALNCFEVLTSINWHLNVVIALLACPLSAKEKSMANEIVQ